MTDRMKRLPTRRHLLTGVGIGTLAAVIAAGEAPANHHEGGGNDALKAKCKKLRAALRRAKQSGNRAKVRRLRAKLRACLRKLNAR